MSFLKGLTDMVAGNTRQKIDATSAKKTKTRLAAITAATLVASSPQLDKAQEATIPDITNTPPSKESLQKNTTNAVDYYKEKGLLSGKTSRKVSDVIEKTTEIQREKASVKTGQDAVANSSDTFGYLDKASPKADPNNPPAGYKTEYAENGSFSFVPMTKEDYKNANYLIDDRNGRKRQKQKKSTPQKNDTSYNTPQSTPELVADMGEYNKQSFSWGNLQNKEDGSKHSSNTKNGKSMSTQEKGLNVGDPGLNLKGVHFQYKGNESERSDEKPDNNQSQIKSNNSEMFAKNSIPTPPPDFEMIPSDDGQNGNNKEGIEQKQPSLDDSTPNQATPQRQPEKRLKKEEDKEKDQPASPDRWPGPTAIAETNTEDSPNDPETEREKPEKIISAMKEGMAKLSSKKLSPANTLELSKLNNQLSSIIIAALGAGVFSQPGNVQAMDTNQNLTPDNTYTQRASAEAINESLIRQAYIDYAKYPENHHWKKITIEEFLNLPENKGKYPGVTADDIRQLMREIDGRIQKRFSLGNIKRPLGKSINSGELSTVKAYLSGKIRPVKPVATNYNQTPGVNNKSNNDIDSRSNVYIGKGSGVDPSQVTASSTSEVSIGGFQNE